MQFSEGGRLIGPQHKSVECIDWLVEWSIDRFESVTKHTNKKLING
jgi:hypothetical protein